MDDVELAKNRIDLEHADLIEKRNAIYLVESSLLISALTSFFTGNGAILIAILIFAIIFDNYREQFDKQIRNKHNEVSNLGCTNPS
jgi:uncharacterized membrane protein YqjE